MEQKSFWANFGPVHPKIAFWGHRPAQPGGVFLCFLPEEHVCDAPGSSDFIFLDDVGIEVLRGVYAGMAQLLRWDTTFSGAVYPICHVPKLLLILDSFCWIDNGHRLAALVLIGKGQRRTLGKQSGKRKHPLTLAVAGIALQQRHLDAFVLLGNWSKGTLFHYLLYFFFLMTITVAAMTAPPLINSNAIHSIRLLLSPVWGVCGSFAVTVSAFWISFVPSLSLKY